MTFKTTSFNYPPDLVESNHSYNWPDNAPIPLVSLVKQNLDFITIAYYPNPNNKTLEDLDKEYTITDTMRGTWSPKLPLTQGVIKLGDSNHAIFTKGDIFCTPTECDRYIIKIKDRVYYVLIHILDKQSSALGRQIILTFNFKGS